MTTANLQNWIGYWDRASMGPSLHNVHTFEDMKVCRMFNPSMQGGVVWDVTDEQMWEALLKYREAA